MEALPHNPLLLYGAYQPWFQPILDDTNIKPTKPNLRQLQINKTYFLWIHYILIFQSQQTKWDGRKGWVQPKMSAWFKLQTASICDNLRRLKGMGQSRTIDNTGTDNKIHFLKTIQYLALDFPFFIYKKKEHHTNQAWQHMWTNSGPHPISSFLICY